MQEVLGLYAHRYGQEHGYRYDQSDLLWEEPRLRTPEQLLLWSRIVAVVRNQLCLARPLVQRLHRATYASYRALAYLTTSLTRHTPSPPLV